MSALAALQDLVDECARRLGTSIVVQDARRRIVAYAIGDPTAVDEVRRTSILGRTTPPEIESWIAAQGIYRAQGPMRVRVPSAIAPGYLGRLGIPLRVRNSLVGVAWLIDERDQIGPAELALVDVELAQSALWLYEEEMAQRVASESLAHLLSPDPELRSHAALELLERGHHHDEELVVVAERRMTSSEMPFGAFPSWLGPTARGKMYSCALMLGDHNAYLIPLAKSMTLAGLRDRLHAVIHQQDPSHAFGIGRPVTNLDQVEQSYRQALRAMRCAERLPELNGVASWAELGILRLLPFSVHGVHGDDVLDDRIRPLLDPQHSVLLHTTMAFLDTGGNVKSTAQAMSIHRGTLYHRLARVESLTGYRLERGLDRLSLHASVTLARLWGFADRQSSVPALSGVADPPE